MKSALVMSIIVQQVRLKMFGHSIYIVSYSLLISGEEDFGYYENYCSQLESQ